MRLFIVMISLLIVGCSSAPQLVEPKVNVNVDTKWKTLIPPNYTEVHAEARTINKPNELEHWEIRIVNESRTKNYCVLSHWQLFEFKNLTKGDWVYIPANQSVHIGYMLQDPWKVDENVSVLIPPAALLVFMELKWSVFGCDNQK